MSRKLPTDLGAPPLKGKTFLVSRVLPIGLTSGQYTFIYISVRTTCNVYIQKYNTYPCALYVMYI